MEIAVKEFTVKSWKAKKEFPQFIRLIFLQKHVCHPCIVRMFGGFWPAPEEIGADDVCITPFFVMERMTCNLEDAQEAQLLESLDSKRRILCDIAQV